MKYLLDTHIILWIAEDSSKFSAEQKAILSSDTCEKFVSIASCWEVAIKISNQKLNLVNGTTEFLKMLSESNIEILQITPKHLITLETLPFHHRDPFDRLLISTALSEGFALLTSDSQISAYEAENLKIVS